MKLKKLFIGNVHTLNKSNLNYGPHFAPLSLSSTTHDISFKKRTLLYKKKNICKSFVKKLAKEFK